MIGSPATAASWPCPLGRTFGKPHEHCIGDRCPIWRWKDIGSDHPKFVAAVRAEWQRLGGGAVKHKEAVANVWKRRAT